MTGLTTALANSPEAILTDFGGLGSWAPTVVASSTAGTPAYTTQVGSYEQIGRLIVARFNILLSGWTGSPSGNISIHGLPVAAANVAGDLGVCFFGAYTVSNLTSADAGLVGTIAASSSIITVFENGQGGTANLTAALAGTTPAFTGCAIYHI